MNEIKKIAVIGAGNVGKTIANYLSNNNLLEWILARSDNSYSKLLRIVPDDKIIRDISDIDNFPDYTILAVSDNSINQISKNISIFFSDLKGKYFSHCSGTLNKDELKPLEESGGIIAAIHPYQTFYNSSEETLKNIPWGIDCEVINESDFSELISILNGKPVILSDKAKKQKELYHISAIVASNYLNTLVALSSELLEEIDMEPEVFIKNIIDTTLDNNYKSLATKDELPLTGPIVRGDIEIIKRHINALSVHPLFLNQYKLIGLATLESAFNNNLLPIEKYNEIKSILH
jgi:predicted short-subunit dehydrogenase-like oxidoreductase (DUF2520 family)